MTTSLEQQLALSVAISSAPASSVRKTFVEPLSDADKKFIEWLSERYEGRLGTPVMTFACDGILTLVCPTDLQRKRADESKHSSTERLHKGSE